MHVVGLPMDIRAVVRQELLYIGREAITNAFAHAQASVIEVTLRCDLKCLMLSIKDNGVGFDCAGLTNTPPAGHWGLAGMKERANTLGGRYQCLSARDGGTQVLVTVPARQAYEGKAAAEARVLKHVTTALLKFIGWTKKQQP